MKKSDKGEKTPKRKYEEVIFSNNSNENKMNFSLDSNTNFLKTISSNKVNIPGLNLYSTLEHPKKTFPTIL
jgi:hypothetical protein